MSDQDQKAANSGAAPEAAAGTMINVHAQYTKDLSFEAPNAPGIYAEIQNASPEINVNVDVSATPLRQPADGKPGLYEVVLDLKAECRSGTKVAFIAELTYGGLFEIAVPEDHLHPILLIECPRLLFPFARNILADVTRDGGFPPLMLSPIDFVQLFQQRVTAERAKLNA